MLGTSALIASPPHVVTRRLTASMVLRLKSRRLLPATGLFALAIALLHSLALVAPLHAQDEQLTSPPTEIAATASLPCVDLTSPTLTTPAYLAAYAAGTASVPPQTGSSYAWTVTGGTITAGSGSNQISLTAGSPGTVMAVSVIATNISGCSAAAVRRRVAIDFSDVPNDAFHDSIDRALTAGVMPGCSAGAFCPTNAVTRAQMAGYLLRSEHGGSYFPPAATGLFNDVPVASPDAPWIEQLYHEGITAGCGSGGYCPSNPVTRAQMAVFLLLTEWGSSYVPPACAGIFADVPCPSQYANWIEQLYNEGTTAGCGGNNYCPAASIQQNQMAVFLVKTFGLLDPTAVWFLDDRVPGSSTTADYSGNGNTGAISGTTIVNGMAGYARHFATASTDWITNNATASANLAKDITLEAWVLPQLNQNPLEATNHILNKAPNTGSPSSYPGNFALYLNQANHLVFEHETDRNGMYAYTAGTVPLNTWTHVAVTWAHGRVRHYVNGALVSDVADHGETAPTNSPVIRIGRRADGRNYVGTVDEVKIWPYARAPRQIASSYAPETSCYKAVPTDNLPDDAALQACLNAGSVLRLLPGQPGYIISSTLVVSNDFTVLTSAATPQHPILLADPALASPVLKFSGRTGIVTGFITIDGNKPNRQLLDSQCDQPLGKRSNVAAGSEGPPGSQPQDTKSFAFVDSTSTHAMCGSALGVYGTDFLISGNSILDNGAGTETPNQGLWSDGITLARCVNGLVTGNTITDATDVAIVDGGGQGCQITNNTINNVNRHVFAGLSLGNFCYPETCGDHTNTIVTGNTVTSALGKMGFGIILGMHPWVVVDAKGATVTGNSATGAVVNLAVDGVTNFTVTGNTVGPRQGTPQPCYGTGTPPAYTDNAAHTTTSTLQTGWTQHNFDGCIP